MISWLAQAPWLAATLGTAALWGMFGALRFGRGPLRFALALLQLPLAGLLLYALLAPPAPGQGTLVVLSGPAAEAPAGATQIVALPGAKSGRNVESVPDLATALRRHPQVERVHVLGDGLAPHDRDALGARTLVFTSSSAAPAPSIVELDPPPPGLAGASWTVRGRVAGDVSATRVELLAPDGAITAQADVADAGRFALTGHARVAGRWLQTLRLRRGDGVLDVTDVPVVARSAEPVRVLLLASVPSPETKFLRRWAVEAGVALDAQVTLGPTLRQQRGRPAYDAAALAQYDLLILDERSASVFAASPETLRVAVHEGLGVLLRITGPMPPRVAAQWRALGAAVELQGPVPRAVTLGEAAPLHAWPVSWTAPAAVPAWRTATGEALAGWTTHGRGRVGVAWLADSFRLVQRGQAARHAELWAALTGAIARARATAAITLQEEPVVGRRSVACGLADGARLHPPRGDAQSLLPGECAAFWPREAGWHRIEVPGEGDDAARERWFHVPEAAGSQQRIAYADRQATRARAIPEPPTSVPAPRPLDRRGMWLAALVLAALGWWLERRVRPVA